MKLENLKSFFKDNFSEKTLLIVSNREPYVHKNSEAGVKVETPVGGLTSALDAVLSAVGGKWVAWGSGDADRKASKNSRVQVPPENPSYTLRRVWLTKTEVDNHYHGYSNQVLWPLCHMTLDRIYFLKRFWEGYVKVNRTFAKAVLEEADDDTVVWVHDYQLCLLPKMLREKRPGLVIAHFWHIPWPNWGVFRVCPQPKKIIEAMLCSDLLGFQIPLFAKNFLDCVTECIEDAEVDYENARVTYKAHTTILKAFPISIDYNWFNSNASAPKTAKTIKNIKNKYKLVGHTGIGVDRLEYTKALLKRLQAIDLLFEKYENFRGGFTFIQVAVPTRVEEPYLSYKLAVEALISKINKKYSSGYWKPIIYIDKKIEHEDLIAYYRMSDVAIISSIYDGMNLVAKEYVASQVDEKGMLILSELAGAAEELEGSILVNPYDIESFTESIKNALVMQDKEKSLRMAVLRKQVRENDIYKWISDIIKEILRNCAGARKDCAYLFDHLDDIRTRLKKAKPMLFLDYDGTLTPIVSSPDKAVLASETRGLIAKLKEVMGVAIISGRGLMDTKERVGIEELIYAGNHGAEIWNGEKVVVSQNISANRLLLNDFLVRIKNATDRFHGILIEDKGATASIHYRLLKPKQFAEFFDTFSAIAAEYEDLFRITSGKKVFELRPLGMWNKGDAVSWITEQSGPKAIAIYIGDDTTDEDAFEAIKDTGISISIGENSKADYYLKSQKEIKDFLKTMRGLVNKG